MKHISGFIPKLGAECRFKPSLDQAQLPKRLLFELANPRLDKVDFDYRAYHYNPVDGTFGPGLP